MDETLAAFADGRLSTHDRAEIIDHLALCDECRAVFDTIADAQDAEVIERGSRGEVVRGHFVRNAVIAALASAAAVTVVFFVPEVQDRIQFWRTGGMSAVVAATEPLKKRDIEGRLGSGFPYKPAKDIHRGSPAVTTGESLDLEKVSLYVAQQELEQHKDSAKYLHSLGLAYLLTGDRAGAIDTLERALQKAGGSDPQILSDLAAAYLEEFEWSQKPEIGKHALDLAVRAWQIRKTPESAWNRALAYQKFGDRNAALAAWQDYLALDSTSPWADEARQKHIADLQNPLD